MASDRDRGEVQSNPGRVRQDGVITGGNLPAPGGVHVDENRHDEFVESSGVNVGPREVRSIKQAVPNSVASLRNSPYGVSGLKRSYQ